MTGRRAWERRRISRLPRMVGISVVGAASLVCAACVTSPVNGDRAAFARAPARHAIPPNQPALEPGSTLLLDVRLDRQIAPNGCGAHVAASLIDYWTRSTPRPSTRPAATGVQILARTPPLADEGYSLAELAGLLRDAGLVALVVNGTEQGILSELAAGRPVIARVSLPVGAVRQKTLFPDGLPLLSGLETRAFNLSSALLGGPRLDHYWIVVGHDANRFIVLDPAMGLRAVERTTFDALFELGGRLAVVSGGWEAQT